MRLVIYKIPEREKVLYNLGQLLEKLCQQKRIGVFCNKEAIKIVDDILWTFSTNIFLPHDIATDDVEYNDRQPVLLDYDLKNLNREILCLFNDNDLQKALENRTTLNKVDCIIYMVQIKNKAETGLLTCYDLIKKMNIEHVDVFAKNNNKWEKVDDNC